jgi:hypothetical protein
VRKCLSAALTVSVALALSSCPANGVDPSPDPTPTVEHISCTMGGSTVTYTNGPDSSRKSFTGDVGKPFITIWGTSSIKLYLYASQNVTGIEPDSSSEPYIKIALDGSGPFSGSSTAALITLQLPDATYTAVSTITLVLDQTVSSSSLGQTISGSFSGTVSSDGGTTSQSISGDFSLVYRNDSWTTS